jgi:DNA-binding response OmpR family regulator
MKILVVEDEICQQEWLTRNLTNAGHEVTTACEEARLVRGIAAKKGSAKKK